MKKLIIFTLCLILLSGLASAALTDNLIEAWTFDSGDGLTGEYGSNAFSNEGAVNVTAKEGYGWNLTRSDGDYLNWSKGVNNSFGADAFSICALVKGTAAHTWGNYLYSNFDGANNGFWFIIDEGGDHNNGFNAVLWNSGANVDIDSGAADSRSQLYDGNYHFYCFARDGDLHSIYVDGELNYSEEISTKDIDNAYDFMLGRRLGDTNQGWNGIIDEFYVWDREIQAAEVAEIWDGGDFLAYPFTVEASNNSYYNTTRYFSNPVYETESPEFSIYIQYNSSITDVNASLNFPYEATLFYASDVNESSGSGYSNFSTSMPVGLIDTNNSAAVFNWTIEIDYANGSHTTETSAENTTYVYFKYFPVNLTLDKYQAVETDNFTATLDFKAGNNPLASYSHVLQFNNTNYSSYSNLNIPILVNNNVNFTLTSFSNITYDTTKTRTATAQLDAYYITLTNCSYLSSTVAYNLSIRHEDLDVLLNGSLDLDFTIWKDLTLYNKTVGFSFPNTQWEDICLYPSFANFTTDAYFIYEVTGGYSHRYYLDSGIVDNETNQLYLYNFNETQTTLALTVYDYEYDYYPNVIVKMLRYYPATHEWKTVQIDKSDDFGLAVFHVIEENTDYKFTFEIDNEVLYSSASMKFSCTADCEISFIMPEPDSAAAPTLDGFLYNYTYDSTTQVITVTWDDTTGVTPNVRFNVTKETLIDTVTVCNQLTSTTSGAFSCNVSGQGGTLFVKGYRSASPELPFLWEEITQAATQLKDQFSSNDHIILGFAMFVTIVFASAWSAAAMIVSSLAGLILISFLGLVSWVNVTFVIAAIIIGLIIILKFKT